MIFGVGCDIVHISRFEKWVSNEAMLRRFFSPEEVDAAALFSKRRSCEYFAARFAAKESLGKALGTGLSGIRLADITVRKDSSGRPLFSLAGSVEQKFASVCGKNACAHLSISHEKEYAVAYVVIETF